MIERLIKLVNSSRQSSRGNLVYERGGSNP